MVQCVEAFSSLSSPPLPVLSEESFVSPSSFQRVNVEGTRVVLRAAQQAPHAPYRFIYVSTDEVYGDSLDQVTTHTHIHTHTYSTCTHTHTHTHTCPTISLLFC